MKSIKHLYCLVSTPKDIYYEQAFISITSLRIHNPNAFVTLLTDRETIDSIQNRKTDIRKIVDEIVIENFESDVSNLKRSRILKTTMRNKIDGDFLFIDGDTIICENLSEIENLKFDISAVLDQHNTIAFSVLKMSESRLKIMLNDANFYEYPHYFNSGVLFVRDTKYNREFFAKWNENYIHGNEKGMPIDQPSLALTNYQLGFPINELNGKWNVQVWHGANYFHNAKIMHYFASDGNEYEPFSHTMHLNLKETGILTENDLSLISQPKGFFGKAAMVVTGDSYEIYRSNIGGFLRHLYKHKFLFNLIDKIFVLPRIINEKLLLRRKNK